MLRGSGFKTCEQQNEGKVCVPNSRHWLVYLLFTTKSYLLRPSVHGLLSEGQRGFTGKHNLVLLRKAISFSFSFPLPSIFYFSQF